MTDTVERVKAQWASMLSAIQGHIQNPLSPFDSRIVVTCRPEEVQTSMDAAGDITVTNDIVFTLDGAEQSISADTISDVMDGGGSFNELMASRLAQLGGYVALTDAVLIRVLLARLGGEVVMTPDDVAKARAPSSIQIDGLKIKLIPA